MEMPEVQNGAEAKVTLKDLFEGFMELLEGKLDGFTITVRVEKKTAPPQNGDGNEDMTHAKPAEPSMSVTTALPASTLQLSANNYVPVLTPSPSIHPPIQSNGAISSSAVPSGITPNLTSIPSALLQMSAIHAVPYGTAQQGSSASYIPTYANYNYNPFARLPTGHHHPHNPYGVPPQ